MSIENLPWNGSHPWAVKFTDPWNDVTRQRFFNTEEEAMAFEAATLALHDREREFVRTMGESIVPGATFSITVSDLLDRYIGSLAHQVSIKTSRYHVSLFDGIFGQRKAHSLTLQDVEVFQTIQAWRGVSQSTVAKRLKIVKSALNWGMRYGLVRENPLAMFRISTPHPQIPAPPTVHEAKRIYEAAAPHIQRVIFIGLSAGPRIGPSELFRMPWSSVDLDRGVMRMPQAAKGARDEVRDIPLRQDVVERMRVWEAEDKAAGIPWVIHFRGKPVKRISRAWHAACDRAGIERRIRPYDLRHAFATMALDAGADLKCVSELMGHANQVMVLRYYQHTNTEQRRRAINTLPSLEDLK
jgi:integrase